MVDISLITPYYITDEKRLGWFKEMIQSVQEQVGVEIEHILINDGSTVNIPAEIFEHDNITNINREHRGRADSSNLGTRVGSGKYRCTISDDDLLPDKFSLFKRFVLAEAEPESSIVWTSGHYIDEYGNIIKEYPDMGFVDGRALINRGGLINNTTAIINRELWLRFSLNEDYSTYEEYDLQIRVAHWSERNGYGFKYFPTFYTGYYRIHKDQGSKNRTLEQKKTLKTIKDNGRSLYGLIE